MNNPIQTPKRKGRGMAKKNGSNPRHLAQAQALAVKLSGQGIPHENVGALLVEKMGFVSMITGGPISTSTIKQWDLAARKARLAKAGAKEFKTVSVKAARTPVPRPGSKPLPSLADVEAIYKLNATDSTKRSMLLSFFE